jgi:hypothetical protein
MSQAQLLINIAASSQQALQTIRGVERAVTQMSTRTSSSVRTANRTLRGFGDNLRMVAQQISAYFIARGVVRVSEAMFDLAADAFETQNMFEVVMGNMASEAEEFTKRASKALGLYETELKDNMAVLFNITNSMGFTEDQAYKLSKGFVSLANDMASMLNLPITQAFRALRAGLVGETEPLRRVGKLTTENALAQYALQKGITKSVKKMSEQEKMILRFIAVMEQSKNEQGDLARTLMSPANALRILQGMFKQAGETLGTVFLPKMIELFQLAMVAARGLDKLGQTLQRVFGTQEKLADMTTTSTQSGKEYLETMKDLASAEGDFKDKVEDTEKALKGTLQAFDEMNVLKEQSNKSQKSIGIDDEFTKLFDAFELYDFLKDADGVIDAQLAVIEDRLYSFVDNVKFTYERLKPNLDAFKGAFAIFGENFGDGLVSFKERVLDKIGNWVMGDGIRKLLDTITDLLENIDYKKLTDSFNGLFDSLGNFATETIAPALEWLLENVLAPISDWAISDLTPVALDLISESIDTLENVLELIKPFASWFWENFLKELAGWTASTLVETLETVTGLIKDLNEAFKKNRDAIEDVITWIGFFVITWGAITFMSYIQTLGGLTGAFKLLKVAIVNSTRALWINISTAIGARVLYAYDLVKAIGATIVALLTKIKVMATARLSMLGMMATVLALAAAFVYLWETSETFRKIVTTAISGVQMVFTTAWAGIKFIFRNFQDWLLFKMPEALLALARKAIDPLTKLEKSFWNIFNNIAIFAVDGINKVIVVIAKLLHKINEVSIKAGKGKLFDTLPQQLDPNKFTVAPSTKALGYVDTLLDAEAKFRAASEQFRKDNMADFNPEAAIREDYGKAIDIIEAAAKNRNDSFSIVSGIKGRLSEVTSLSDEVSTPTELTDETIEKLTLGFIRGLQNLGNNNNKSNGTDSQAIFQLDGKELARTVLPYLQEEARNQGTDLIISGVD